MVLAILGLGALVPLGFGGYLLLSPAYDPGARADVLGTLLALAIVAVAVLWAAAVVLLVRRLGRALRRPADARPRAALVVGLLAALAVLPVDIWFVRVAVFGIPA